MTTITDRTFKLRSMIKKTIVTNQILFAVVTFSRTNSFAYINPFFRNAAFIRLNHFQKDCQQDNLSLACLQIYQRNCLNILAGSIFFVLFSGKESIETTVKDSHSISFSCTFNSGKLQPWTKCLTKTLVFMWNSALR